MRKTEENLKIQIFWLQGFKIQGLEDQNIKKKSNILGKKRI